MKILPISSGSSGNCYVVREDDGPALMLDAGLSISRIKQGLWDHDMRLGDVEACLVSHLHQDHCKGVEGLLRAGVRVLMPEETREELGLEDHGQVSTAFTDSSFTQAGYRIEPYPLSHGDTLNLGYLVSSSDNHLFYGTDCLNIPYIFNGLTHLMIEINYQDKYIEDSDQVDHQTKALTTHMSLQTALDYLDRIDLESLREIWVIHLSETHANRDEVKRKIQEKTGVMVRLA